MNIGKRLSIFLSIIFVLLSSGCTVQKTEGQLYNEKVIEKAKEIDQKLKVSGYTKTTIAKELLGIYCPNIENIPVYSNAVDDSGVANEDVFNNLNIKPGIIEYEKLNPYEPLIENIKLISANQYRFSCLESGNSDLYKETMKIYDFTNSKTYETEKNNNKEFNQRVIPFKNHRDSINIPEMEAKQQHPRFAMFGNNYGTKFVSRDNYFKSNTNYDQKEKDKYEAEKKFWFIVDVFMQLDLPSE